MLLSLIHSIAMLIPLEKEALVACFYNLLSFRRELFILDLEQESNYLVSTTFNSDSSFHQMAVKGFSSLQSAFDKLNFSPNESKAIFMLIAACLHLGLAGTQKGSVFFIGRKWKGL